MLKLILCIATMLPFTSFAEPAEDIGIHILDEQHQEEVADWALENDYWDFYVWLSGAEDSIYGCDTDCGAAASFRYPCPTFRNPGRKCTGKNHVKYAACEADKAVACRMMNAINEKAYQLAMTGKENETIQDRNDCVIIVTAGLAAYGTAHGGPWVGLATGAAGGAAASLACRKAFPL